MATMASAEQVGRAWRLHRDGDNAGAIGMFESILAANPDHVDALYGLGLAQRAAGDPYAAADAFRQALRAAEEALAAVKTTAQTEGNLGDNDLGSNIDDRYMMLTRMISQRLEDLAGSLA